jgi:hypothetical protein
MLLRHPVSYCVCNPEQGPAREPLTLTRSIEGTKSNQNTQPGACFVIPGFPVANPETRAGGRAPPLLLGSCPLFSGRQSDTTSLIACCHPVRNIYMPCSRRQRSLSAATQRSSMSGPEEVSEPGLAAPWKALFDPKTQLKYYWNPATNVVTYQRPEAEVAPVPSAAYGAASDGYRSRDRDADRYAAGPSNGHHSSASVPVVNTASGLDYRKQQDIVVLGDNVPDPFTSIHAAGFPADILEEVSEPTLS